ncbi:MAG: tetratricopeptide repeat protein, partial [Cyanobacteria bacterium]|nr:tetratricopeptide repeat protein [Cyanobacteriota bacterium]
MIHTSVFHQAFEAHTLGDYPTAQRLYESLLKTHPEDPQVIHLLGLIAYEQKDYLLAREKMAQSLLLCPEDPLFQNNFGLVLEALGEEEAAQSAYLAAIHFSKRDVNNQSIGSDGPSAPYIDPYLNLGALFQSQGKRCEAAKFYYRGLRLDKNAPDLLNNLGTLYKAAWKSPKAEVFFREALQMDPYHGDALLNLAGVCLDRGEILEALMLYEKYREISPNNHQGLLGIGACYLAQGDFRHAQSAFFQRLQQEPSCDESRKGLLKINAFHGFSQLLPFSGGNVLSQQPKIDTSGQVLIISQCALDDLGGGHQPPQIGRSLAKMGHSVRYVHLFSNREPSSTSQEAIFPAFQDIYIPQQFPPQEFQMKPWQQLLSQWTLSESNFKILLFTVYSPYLVGLIPLFKAAGFQTAYWCIDDHEAFGDEKLRTENEALLAKAVDVCFASSLVLKEKMEGLTGK